MNRLRWSVRCARIAQQFTTVNYTGKRCIARWVAPTIREIVHRKIRAGPEPEPIRSNFLEWNYDAEIYAFNKRLSEKFDDELLSRAFTFRSHLTKERNEQLAMGMSEPIVDTEDNEDLIDDGRRTTERIIEVYLRRALPKVPEDCISALRNYLTSQENLAKVSAQIGTRDLILSAEHPISEETLADTFYALVSALAMSTNDPIHVSKFVRDFLIACLSDKEITEIWQPRDPEDHLNEILRRENRETAEPRLIGEAGTNDILAVYQIGLYSSRQLLGKGFGQTIKEAREAAAITALNRMFGIGDSCRPIRYDLTIDPTASDVGMENLPLSQWCNDNIEKIMRQ